MIKDFLLKPFSLMTPYGAMGALGAVSGVLYILLRTRFDKSRKFWDLIYVYVWALIGAVIGAKVLYILLNIRKLYFVLSRGGDILRQYISSVALSGFVFYGGLFGAIAAVLISSGYFRFGMADTLEALTPCIPLFHGFGRIGCHLAGCCYGRATGTDFGIIYQDNAYAPNGVRLYPVQLAEAVLNFLVFIYLAAVVIMLCKRKNAGMEEGGISGGKLFIFRQYLLIYAIIRFVLEFFRGDAARGRFAFFSTSQWISILIIAFAAGWMVRERRVKANERVQQD